MERHPSRRSTRRIGLVGCVKEKATRAMPARDLYVSALFRGRQAYVQQSCTEWWILSAEHGLVHPDQVLAPYDKSLKDLGRAERRAWSRSVVHSLDQLVRPDAEDVVELHAGAEYRDYGLTDGLRGLGCHIDIPTAGLPIGRQLQFYRSTHQ